MEFDLYKTYYDTWIFIIYRSRESYLKSKALVKIFSQTITRITSKTSMALIQTALGAWETLRRFEDQTMFAKKSKRLTT